MTKLELGNEVEKARSAREIWTKCGITPRRGSAKISN